MRTNPYRLIAATTSITTALVLQAGLLNALTAPLAVSLPAVLVAAVGLCSGVSAGLSMGFCAGLLADLSSRHPAGVLALCWLTLGLTCGLLADPRRRLRWSLVLAGVAAAVAGLVASTAIDALSGTGLALGSTLVRTGPTVLVDLILAAAVIGPTRAVLRAFQAPGPVRRVRWGRAPVAADTEPVAAAHPVVVRSRRRTLRGSEVVVDA